MQMESKSRFNPYDTVTDCEAAAMSIMASEGANRDFEFLSQSPNFKGVKLVCRSEDGSQEKTVVTRMREE